MPSLKPLQDLVNVLGEAVIDPEEESFLVFSQEIPSQDLGFLDPKASILELTVGGRDLTVHQSPTILSSNREGGTTGAVLWKITPLFAEWISSPQNLFFRQAFLHSNATVLELGCGVSGVLALAVAPSIGRYIATDQDYALKLLYRNLEENASAKTVPSNHKRSTRKHASASKSHQSHPTTNSNIDIMALDWETTSLSALPAIISSRNASASQSASAPTPTYSSHTGLDAVIACDCIYNDALITPFVQTCADLCKLRTQSPSQEHAQTPTVCIIAQQLRSAEVFEAWVTAFCELFVVWRLPDDVLCDELREGHGFVVHLGVLKEQFSSPKI